MHFLSTKKLKECMNIPIKLKNDDGSCEITHKTVIDKPKSKFYMEHSSVPETECVVVNERGSSFEFTKQLKFLGFIIACLMIHNTEATMRITKSNKSMGH